MGLTQADYTRLLGLLLPNGPAWDEKTDPDSLLNQLLQGQAAGFVSLYNRTQDLLREADPSQAVELLPEWEAYCGLPDACMPLATTLTQRRNRVLGRLSETGGQSKAYLVAVAAAYGYPITITEYPYFRVGTGRVGQAINGVANALSFTVNYPSHPISQFRVGTSRVGEPLVAYDNATLECIINRLKPAQTFAFFNYT